MVRWCRGELRCIAQPNQPGQGFLFELVFGHGFAGHKSKVTQGYTQLLRLLTPRKDLLIGMTWSSSNRHFSDESPGDLALFVNETERMSFFCCIVVRHPLTIARF